jgi:hypothetical protein
VPEKLDTSIITVVLLPPSHPLEESENKRSVRFVPAPLASFKL